MPLIVGYDGSDGSNYALKYAVALGAELNDPVFAVFGAEPPGPKIDEITAHRAVIADHAEKVLAEGKKIAASVGGDIKTEIVPKRPTEALIAVAERESARMIIVGGAETGRLRAILGAVPHKLLHVSDTPVLVVPPPDED